MKNLFIILFCISLLACQSTVEKQADYAPRNNAKGKLFIIGGGKRPPSLVKKLIDVSEIAEKGFGIILPMSSSEPDSAIYYSKLQFTEQGINNVIGFNFSKGDIPSSSQLDSIENATLIYISGGDQNKFMNIIKGTGIGDAIRTAYQQGSTIAGTSAGAAVMSQVMITGDERNYPDYYNTLRTIEKNNIITSDGLGLVSSAIIDQHFIQRGRYNRLLSICIENPDLIGFGIDESTALLVEGDSATVVGESQIIRMIVEDSEVGELNQLLVADSVKISILAPGDKISMYK